MDDSRVKIAFNALVGEGPAITTWEELESINCEADKAGVDLYACTRASTSGWLVGVVEQDRVTDVLICIRNVVADRPATSSGDCGAPWFLLVPNDSGNQFQLRLIGHHCGAANISVDGHTSRKVALAIPLEYSIQEIKEKILPNELEEQEFDCEVRKLTRS